MSKERLYYKYKGQEAALLEYDLSTGSGDMYRCTSYINGVYQRNNFWARVRFDAVGPKLIYTAQSGVKAGAVATYTLNENFWRTPSGSPLSEDEFLVYIGCVEL